jgi:hypothetical protein
MKRRTLGVLLRNDFENATGVRHVHETVGAEHQAEKTALPPVLNSNDEKKRGATLRTHRYSESSDPPGGTLLLKGA